MAACPQCGAPRTSAAAPCPKCGNAAASAQVAGGPPSLELDLPARPAAPPRAPAPPRPAAPSRGPSSAAGTHAAVRDARDVTIDLAFDPRAAFTAKAQGAIVESGSSSLLAIATPATGSRRIDLYDVESDARLLAEYGPVPTSWAGFAFYAWRVVKRRSELRHALAQRREEAVRARAELENALVVFAERVRGQAETHPSYSEAFERLRRAEEVLRSRDQVLSAENDAHGARLASVDARIAKLEEERQAAAAAERAKSAELAALQTDLGREEAQLKRADIELRAIQQREAARSRE